MLRMGLWRSGADSSIMRDITTKMRTSARHVYWLREKLRRRFGAPTNEVILTCCTRGMIYHAEGRCREGAV